MNERVSREHVDRNHVDSVECPSVETIAEDGDDCTVAAIDVDEDTGRRPDSSLPAVEQLPLELLAAALESLRNALAASLRTQEYQQVLLDKIHDEKERLREAEQRRQRDPILRDLIQLSDTCLRTRRQWRARTDVSPETAEKVSAVLLEVADDIKLILERQGVEDFAPIVENKFQRNEAKAVGTRPTTDLAFDGLVAEVRKPGYRLGDRVLRFSEVVVWRLDSVSGDSESQ